MVKEYTSYGVGACLRNERGELLQAFSMWHLDSPGAQEAEAYGLSVGEVYL